jgi:hypothetical protein
VQPLRYYHYISATKVEMLYAQLPSGRRHSSEVSGGLPGVLQAKHGLAPRDAEPTLYEKLARVEEEINRNHSPGSPGWDNEPYIRGRAKLWVVVIDRESNDQTDSPRQAGGTVLFAGRTPGADLVLGGSKAHLLLGPGMTPASGDSSFFYLQHAVGQAARNWRSLRADDVLDSDVLIGEQDDQDVADSFMRDSIQYIVSEAVDRATQFKPVGHCEYLARTICQLEEDQYSDPYGRHWRSAVLATPLYVAHVEVADESEQSSVDDPFLWPET